MKPKSSIEPLLFQAAELLTKLKNGRVSCPPEMMPQVIAEIERLERNVAIFNELNQKTYSEAGIDIAKLKRDWQKSSTIDDKSKRNLKMADELEKDSQRFKSELEISLKRAQQLEHSIEKDGGVTKTMKERRKKFKRLGGDKNWIPM